MATALHKTAIHALALLSATLVAAMAFADDPHWSPELTAQPASSDAGTSSQPENSVSVTRKVGAQIGNAVKDVRNTNQLVQGTQKLAKDGADRARQQAAEQLSAATGGALSLEQANAAIGDCSNTARCSSAAQSALSKYSRNAAAEQFSLATGGVISSAQAKELIGNCSSTAQCMSSAQSTFARYSEDAAAAQLISQTGMAPTMAMGKVKGCASGGSGCSQVVMTQGANYLTGLTSQTMSQYTQYASEANLRMAASCASSGNSSQCQEAAKQEAVNKLMGQTGLNSDQATQLMAMAKDPSRYASNLQNMAESRVKSVVNMQVNKLAHLPIGNTGISIASLQSMQKSYQTLAAMLKMNKRAAFDGLGQLSKGVVARQQASVYTQKNSYNPVKDGALYYGNNTQDLTNALKLAASIKKDPNAAIGELTNAAKNRATTEIKGQVVNYIDSQPTQPGPGG